MSGKATVGSRGGFWILNCHATVQLAAADGAGGTSVIRLLLPPDEAPSLHVHHAKDEVFCLLRGEIRFVIGGAETVAGAGQTLPGPKGAPHGFRVLSEGAERLVINKGGFEHLVRGMARPAEHDGPPTLAEPTPEMQAARAACCGESGIELVGPPIA